MSSTSHQAQAQATPNDSSSSTSTSASTSTTDASPSSLSKSKPNYIYKIVDSSLPIPTKHADLPERLPISSLDSTSGFIHLSTSTQVPGTLKFFFSDVKSVYMLRLLYDNVEKELRWEDPKAEVCGPRNGEGMFPHLYNGLKLGKDEIESVRFWERRNDDETWNDVIKRNEAWLLF